MLVDQEGKPLSTETPQKEPDEVTAAALRYWGGRIESSEDLNKDFRRKIKQNRQYVRGKVHDDGSPGLVRTNLIHSTIATLTPHIYAKDPDVSVSPVEHVAPMGYGAIRKFSKTAELVLRRKVIQEGKLKKRLKSNIRSIFTTGVGWLKMIYQSDLIYDPLTSSRIHTLQDNLRSIDVQMARLSRPGDVEKMQQAKFELLRQLEAVKGEKEPRSWKGIVLDRVLSEDILLLDTSITDFEDYAQSDAIAHGIWMADDKYEETFGYKPSGSAFQPESMPDTLKREADKRQMNFKRVYEVWSLKTNSVMTMCLGEKRWAREPYTPEHLPHRFYPFYCGAFFPVDGDWQPLDLVDMMKELQDEYNTTRTTYAKHRKDAIPVRVVRQGGTLTPEDIAAIQAREAGDIIVVNGTGRNDPIGNDMGHLPNIPLDPAMYDVSQIRADMDIVSGTPDASRGDLIEAKTATEASILQEGMNSRSGDMRDNTEDLITEIMSDALQILMQCMKIEEVTEIAGQGAVWPTLSRDQVFGLVSIGIQGGSTARPNKDKEKQQWIELLPVLREFIVTIGEVLASGNTQLGSAMVQLMKETLTRFDERLDIQSIMPFASADGEGLDQGEVNAQTQLQQLQAGMQEMQQYVAQLEQQLQEAQSELQNGEAARDTDLTKHREMLDQQKEMDLLRMESELDSKEQQEANGIVTKMMELRQQRSQPQQA